MNTTSWLSATFYRNKLFPHAHQLPTSSAIQGNCGIVPFLVIIKTQTTLGSKVIEEEIGLMISKRYTVYNDCVRNEL